MRCRYSFPVFGYLRLASNAPIRTPDRTVEFALGENQVVTAILVTVDAGGPENWPTIRPSGRPGAKAHIDLREPRYEEIASDLRVLEGLLAFYGLKRIDFDSASVEWMPESEEESAQLSVRSFKRGYEAINAHDAEPVPLDLVARSVLAASRMHALEVPLSFCRKGLWDLKERRFIEAFYDFYFMLETLFAQGHSRTKVVKELFKGSPTLRAAVERALNAYEREPKTAELNRAFRQKYHRRSVDQVIDHLVNLRGFLHHHSLGRPGIWHPEGHSEYEIDALVIGRVAFELGFALAAPYVLTPDIAVSIQTGRPPL